MERGQCSARGWLNIYTLLRSVRCLGACFHISLCFSLATIDAVWRGKLIVVPRKSKCINNFVLADHGADDGDDGDGEECVDVRVE